VTTARDIGKWERCKEIASELGVAIRLSEGFMLTHDGLTLGVMYSLDEVYGFLCGYEHKKEVSRG
jgi:hypothetical protein